MKKKSDPKVQKVPAVPAIKKSEQVIPAPEPVTGENAVLSALNRLQATMDRLVTTPASAEAALDGTVNALRRLLSDLVEQDRELIMTDLVALRTTVGSGTKVEPGKIQQRIDDILKKLGASSFEAVRLDYVDPLIHTVASEKTVAGVAEGVILETLSPGFRTSRGKVIAKARIAVNGRG